MMNQRMTREINGGELSNRIRHGEQEILQYEITYPIIKARTAIERNINKAQLDQARRMAHTIENRYLAMAQEQYKALEAYQGFAPLEIHASFQVMYNSPSLVSLFTDTYFRLRHKGSRLTRVSFTYDMNRGTTLSLAQLVGQGEQLRQAVYTRLAAQIEREDSLNPGSYFNDWRQLYQSRLQKGGFYLTDEGVVLYYRQDTIANQNAGLPSFLIPYDVFPDGVSFL